MCMFKVSIYEQFLNVVARICTLNSNNMCSITLQSHQLVLSIILLNGRQPVGISYISLSFRFALS